MTGDDNKFGLEVRVLGAGGVLGLSANKWTDRRAAGCAGRLKTSGTDSPHCLQSLIIPRTRICCRPGLITLQHLEPAHCSTAGSADIPRPGRRHAMRGQGWDWPEDGVSRGAKAIQWPGMSDTGARIRKRKSEPTQSELCCVQSSWELVTEPEVPRTQESDGRRFLLLAHVLSRSGLSALPCLSYFPLATDFPDHWHWPLIWKHRHRDTSPMWW